MRTNKLFLSAILMVAFSSVILVSCQKGTSTEGSKQLQVYLTDGPADYDAVNIEILTVEAKVDTNAAHCRNDHFGDADHNRDDQKRGDEFGTWVNLNASPGVYNVLTLRNGIDTLLATGTVNGTVRKVRLTIGTNNTVVKNGVSYPLVISNETGNYLYVHLRNEHRRDSSAHTGVWIDFDISRSIVEENGVFYLKPHLRPFCDKNFAGLEGKVTPAEAKTVITVYNSTDTATAIPNPDGRFRVRGLSAGTYTVVYDASNGYKDTTITNVALTTGRSYRLPDVVLHQ